MNTLVRRVFVVLLCCVTLLLNAPFVSAQNERGAISGIISDATGAVVPGAKVAATADDTGIVTTATTNESGNYALLYLNPGTYTVTAEHAGFKKLVQKQIVVSVGGDFKLDLKLEIGNMKTEVSVTEEAPRIETANADVGVTMTNQQIADLPLTDGNPFTLARLAPGAVFTGDPTLARPFDNANVSAIQINGSSGAVNYGLNGSPNTGHQIGHNNVLSFMPPADALFEFKMTTSSYRAESGHSAGGSVNINTKSGTNKFHGTLYEQNRNEALEAFDFFTKMIPGQRKPVMRLNHYGGTIGGPVEIPKVYDGHNKTFFFFATDHMIDSFPKPGPTTVPTLGEKGLDASGNSLGYLDFGSACQSGFYSNGLCKDGGQLYNPFTTVYQPGSTSNVQRSIYPFNRIPMSDVNPVGLAIANFFPNPNTTGNIDGTNNYYSPNSRHDWFHSYMARLDHVLSTRQSLHVNYQQNWREESRDNPFGPVTNPILSVTMAPKGNNLYYRNYGGQVGDTVTISNSSVLDVRLGFSQFSDVRRPAVLGFDPATLGLSNSAISYVQQLTGVENYLPYFNMSGFNSVGNTNSRYENDVTNTGYMSATLNRVMGKHLFAFGYEGRLIRENSFNLGNPLGYYTFSQTYVEATNSSTSQPGGWQSLASMMLGLPNGNSSYVDLNTSSANQRIFHGAYIQDDWKVGSKLTLNLGIRWEIEGAPTERHDRNILGFDPTGSTAAGALAAANFGLPTTAWVNGTFDPQPSSCSGSDCPIGPITLSSFQTLGGLMYTNSKNRSFYHVSPFNFQPRFGLAYALYPKTVIRGGVGLFSTPLSGASDNGSPGFNQNGYSQQTKAAYSTQNNGINFFGLNTCNPSPCPQAGTIYNMFPGIAGTSNGVIMPLGNTLGLETDWGQSIDISPLPLNGNPKIGRALSWSFDLQQELPGKWTLVLSYVGRKAWNLEEDSNYLNAVPAQYFDKIDQLNNPNMQAWNSQLTSSSLKGAVYNMSTGAISYLPIGNPFNSLIGTNNSYYATTNLTLAQMLRPFPQFGDITTGLFNAGSFYNGGSVMLNRRFANGYQLYFTYTRSKAMADNGFLNDFETTPQHHLDYNDSPNRISATFVGQLPIGHGRKFANNLPRWIDAIVGGWQSGVVYQYQTGFPVKLSNDMYYAGDWTQLSLNLDPKLVANGQVFDVSGFYPNLNGGTACLGQVTNPVLKSYCYGDTQVNLSNYHYRTLPLDFGNLRNPGQNNWDINAVKKIRIKEKASAELRADFLNAFNHPWFNGVNMDPTASNFGQVSQTQKNLPRTIQIGMKVIF